jgi:hypothetical protein
VSGGGDKEAALAISNGNETFRRMLISILRGPFCLAELERRMRITDSPSLSVCVFASPSLLATAMAIYKFPGELTFLST